MWLLSGDYEVTLCSVVEILELFNHPSEDLKIALQRHVDLFNPRDYSYTVSYNHNVLGYTIIVY